MKSAIIIFKYDKKRLHKITPRSSEDQLLNELVAKNRNQVDEHYIEHCLTVKYHGRMFKVNLLLTVATFLTVIVAVAAPWIQEMIRKPLDKKTELQNLFSSISYNNKLFIDQFNERNQLFSLENLPTLYFSTAITPYLQDVLQKEIGIVNYQFLNFYLSRIEFINTLIAKLQTQAVINGLDSKEFSDTRSTYIKFIENAAKDESIESLRKNNLIMKFNFITDPACLKEILMKSFSFIKSDANQRNPNCSVSSLNRIYYYFGDLVDMPEWQKPRFRDALKAERGIDAWWIK